jgi:hypothetical protein
LAATEKNGGVNLSRFRFVRYLTRSSITEEITEASFPTYLFAGVGVSLM